MRYLPKDHELPLMRTSQTRLGWWLGEVAFLRGIDHLPPAEFIAAIDAAKGRHCGQVCEAARGAAYDATPEGMAALADTIARLEAQPDEQRPSPYAYGAAMDTISPHVLAGYWRDRLAKARALAAQFEPVAA